MSLGGSFTPLAFAISKAIFDSAHDFQTAVDRGRTRAIGKPRPQGFQRLIMNLLRFEISDV